jgi:hypothetical protein
MESLRDAYFQISCSLIIVEVFLETLSHDIPMKILVLYYSYMYAMSDHHRVLSS